MNEFLELYDIEVNDKNITIEALYFNENINENIFPMMKNINSKQIKAFTLSNNYYDKHNNLKGRKCKIILNLKNAEYEIIIKNNNSSYTLNWHNNQRKFLDFNKNKFKIFTKNYVITMSNNGLKISDRKLFFKTIYNIDKIIYGLKNYNKLFCYRIFKSKEKYYLINDRVSEGNDNGEALFRYICSNRKDIAKRTYYVINKNNTAKFNELKKLGNVLKFGSIKHKIKFINSKIIATSYIGNGANVYNPFNQDEMEIYKDLINKKTIFLQHGILMSDFHLMFNRARMCIDKFVVSTTKELNSIMKYDYLYDENQLIKTGLARYDMLSNNPQNKILIFFTWRKWLAKLSNSEFKRSDYYKKIKALLKNKEFIKKVKQNNCTIQFVLHAELSNYYELFKSFENKYIKVYKSNEINYSNTFNECNMLITDYSSIHFDISYLKKPVIYYQFDQKEFFNNHTSNGFSDFSYEKDGFGDVITNDKSLLIFLDQYIKNDFKMKTKYAKKINDIFFNIDNNNSKRITDVMESMYTDNSKNYRFNNVQ